MPRTRRRFEADDVIAIRIDREGGYRQATDPQWRLVTVGSLRDRSRGGSRRIDLAPLLEGLNEAPRIELERLAEGDVLVDASLPMALLRYGDTTPQRVEGSGEAPYGSVFRAGPVLVAPLYAEQAESLVEGRLCLPSIGEVAARGEEDSDDPDAELAEGARRARGAMKAWGWIWGGSFLVPVAALVASFMVWSEASFVVRPVGFCFVVLVYVLPAWILSLTLGLPIHRLVEEWCSRLGASAAARWSGMRRRIVAISVWYAIWLVTFAAVGGLAIMGVDLGEAFMFLRPHALAQLLAGLDPFTATATLVAAGFPVFLLGLPIHFFVAFRAPAMGH